MDTATAMIVAGGGGVRAMEPLVGYRETGSKDAVHRCVLAAAASCDKSVDMRIGGYTRARGLSAPCSPICMPIPSARVPTDELAQARGGGVTDLTPLVIRGCRKGEKKNSECPIRPTMAAGG